jgi:hypothetical protein
MIEFRITPRELWDIIQLFPPDQLNSNDIDQLILIIMSYYHL